MKHEFHKFFKSKLMIVSFLKTKKGFYKEKTENLYLAILEDSDYAV